MNTCWQAITGGSICESHISSLRCLLSPLRFCLYPGVYRSGHTCLRPTCPRPPMTVEVLRKRRLAWGDFERLVKPTSPGSQRRQRPIGPRSRPGRQLHGNQYREVCFGTSSRNRGKFSVGRRLNIFYFLLTMEEYVSPNQSQHQQSEYHHE
jgi:hypothetical protein